jgi:hypothetical protein
MAGLLGYVVGIITDATFEAFGAFSPLIPILGFVYSIVTFYSGIQDAYVKGVFFSFGIIVAGLLLKDFVTVISGVISMVGLIIGIIKR